jgi:hypothetical protein
MSTGGGEQWKDIGIMVGTISGIIALIKLVIMPIAKAWRKWREKHPPFRRTVLQALEQLQNGQTINEDFMVAFLRERLEDAYVKYVLDMGWCPSREKRLLGDLFKISEAKGWDHLDERHRELIMSLPESKDQRKDYPQ